MLIFRRRSWRQNQGNSHDAHVAELAWHRKKSKGKGVAQEKYFP